MKVTEEVCLRRIHDALQALYNDRKVRITSIEIEWLPVDTIGEPMSRVVQLNTTAQADV